MTRMQDTCMPIEVRGLNKFSSQTMRCVASIVLACKGARIKEDKKKKKKITRNCNIYIYSNELDSLLHDSDPLFTHKGLVET